MSKLFSQNPLQIESIDRFFIEIEYVIVSQGGPKRGEGLRDETAPPVARIRHRLPQVPDGRVARFFLGPNIPKREK
jgi:hypothetical protein